MSDFKVSELTASLIKVSEIFITQPQLRDNATGLLFYILSYYAKGSGTFGHDNLFTRWVFELTDSHTSSVRLLDVLRSSFADGCSMQEKIKSFEHGTRNFFKVYPDEFNDKHTLFLYFLSYVAVFSKQPRYYSLVKSCVSDTKPVCGELTKIDLDDLKFREFVQNLINVVISSGNNTGIFGYFRKLVDYHTYHEVMLDVAARQINDFVAAHYPSV